MAGVLGIVDDMHISYSGRRNPACKSDFTSSQEHFLVPKSGVWCMHVNVNKGGIGGVTH